MKQICAIMKQPKMRTFSVECNQIFCELYSKYSDIPGNWAKFLRKTPKLSPKSTKKNSGHWPSNSGQTLDS